MGKRGLCQLDHSKLQLHYGPSDLLGGLQEISEMPVLFLVLRAALQIPECLWTPQLPAVGMSEVRDGAADLSESQCCSGHSRSLSSGLQVLLWLTMLMHCSRFFLTSCSETGCQKLQLYLLRAGLHSDQDQSLPYSAAHGGHPHGWDGGGGHWACCALPAEVPGGVHRPSDQAYHWQAHRGIVRRCPLPADGQDGGSQQGRKHPLVYVMFLRLGEAGSGPCSLPSGGGGTIPVPSQQLGALQVPAQAGLLLAAGAHPCLAAAEGQHARSLPLVWNSGGLCTGAEHGQHWQNECCPAPAARPGATGVEGPCSSVYGFGTT